MRGVWQLVVACAVGAAAHGGWSGYNNNGYNSYHGYNPSYHSHNTPTRSELYIKAEEVSWDYAPSGDNKCTGEPLGQDVSNHLGSQIFTTEGIGKVYRKAVFRGYTDQAFGTAADHPDELGILGPQIDVEPGDTIRVTLRNTLDFPVSITVPGPFVAGEGKGAETAPGATKSYTWEVPKDIFKGQPKGWSQAFLYRSGVSATEHDNAGLLGAVLVKTDGAPRTEFVTVLQVINENSSPYLDKNVASFAPSHGLGDDDFEESNLMHAINGRMYCNLDGLELTVGESARWHVAAVGTEVDLHNAHWHGLVGLLHGRHATDELSITPGVVKHADFEVDNAGVWLFHCHVNDHLFAGMQALFTVSGASPAPLGGTVREYYVAAVEENWAYDAGSGESKCEVPSRPFNDDENVFMETSIVPARVGAAYKKARFVEHTDASFTTRVTRSAAWEHLGLVGPLLRAEVGDTIVVHFKNAGTQPFSLHPHGVLYAKDSEGAPYNDGTSGSDKQDDGVPAGATHTYTWEVPKRAGPGPADPSSVLWMYHSHTDEIIDTNSGLFGGIIVTAAGQAKGTSPTPKDVDREFVLFMSVLNEGTSYYIGDNVQAVTGAALTGEVEEDEDFQESNLMHQVNGYMYCNAPRLDMEVGERVRFYIMALGTEVDMHTPHWEALVTNWEGESRDTIQLIAGAMTQVDARITAPGDGIIECSVADHTKAGMRARYHVTNPTPAVLPSLPRARLADYMYSALPENTYFIQAQEVMWDYAPTGKSCGGAAFGDDEEVFLVRQDGDTIGRVYKKAVYRGYTGDDFKTLAKVPMRDGMRTPVDAVDRQSVLGHLGPLLRADAGGALRIVFRNALPGGNALTNDANPSGATGVQLGGGLVLRESSCDCPSSTWVAVAPGCTCTATYAVPEQSGPGAADGGAAAYVYRSGIDAPAQVQAGLQGVLLVDSKGSKWKKADFAYGPYPLMFTIMNENESPYLAENMALAGSGDASEDFEESNLMHAINGYLFCNLPVLKFARGKTVRWVIAGLGSELDMHTPTFAGSRHALVLNALQRDNTNLGAGDVMPGVAKVYDFTPAAKGRFEMKCFVHDHADAGMRAEFDVTVTYNTWWRAAAKTNAGTHQEPAATIAAIAGVASALCMALGLAAYKLHRRGAQPAVNEDTEASSSSASPTASYLAAPTGSAKLQDSDSNVNVVDV